MSFDAKDMEKPTRKTTHSNSAHTPTADHHPVDAPPARGGLPNRLMTAFQIAEFIGCHEETVRRAYVLTRDENRRDRRVHREKSSSFSQHA